MRFVMQVSLPPERFSQAVRDGSAGQSPSEIPRFAEPWFLNFDAEVEFLPTMTPEDLQKSGLDDIAKKWK